MAKSVKPEKILESLKKLYEKRKGLDQQILETEKSLVVATSAQAGNASAVAGKSAGRPKKKVQVSKRPPAKRSRNKES
jgi:hypothetical protein